MTMHRPPLRPTRLLLPTAVLALLWGCAGEPRKTDETPTAAVSTITQPQVWQIEPDVPESEWESTFATADAALSHLNWMDAETALRPLETSLLNSYDAQQLAFMRARIAHVRGQESVALEQLDRLEQADLPPGLDYDVYAFHQKLLHLTGRYMDAAKLGVTALQFSSDEKEKHELKQAVWRDLQRSQTSALNTAFSTTPDAEWRGWIELALMTRHPGPDLQLSLRQWEAAHPAHGASNPLPGGLEELARSTVQVNSVALILPLSGRLATAGRAVRDGYLAGFLEARQNGSAPPQLMILDSESFNGSIEAYQHAVASGAQLVVGPLQKEAVAELDTLLERPIPIIALNRVDPLPPLPTAPAAPQPVAATADPLQPGPGANTDADANPELETIALPAPTPQSLVQLSLAPEDEVRCLADRAFGEGVRRILILRPAGAWGDKVEDTLTGRWQSLGGSVADSISYTGSEEYSESVKSGLGIAASDARRSRLRDMLATNIEFTPRRRQDIDAVVLLSPGPEDARALKPMLAFYYAGSLPVYAPSGVYSGQSDVRDRDLKGVRVVEIPWLVGDESGLRKELSAAHLEDYPRLNALGADAYLLQSRLGQLEAGQAALLRGSTGLLSLNADNQIERDLPLAEFDGGRLKPR